MELALVLLGFYLLYTYQQKKGTTTTAVNTITSHVDDGAAADALGLPAGFTPPASPLQLGNNNGSFPGIQIYRPPVIQSTAGITSSTNIAPDTPLLAGERFGSTGTRLPYRELL